MKPTPNLFNAQYYAETAARGLTIATAFAAAGQHIVARVNAETALRDLDKAREQLVMALDADERRAA